MGNLVDDLMDDTEGSPALVVADDDGLRESLPEVLRELGFAVTLRSLHSAACATLNEHAPFALALLCIGRGTSEQMAFVVRMLASPALVGANVLLGTTAFAAALPTLPDAGRVANIAYLSMPFELDTLEELAQTCRTQQGVAVPVRSLIPFSEGVAWDGAVVQPRHLVPVERTLSAGLWRQPDLTDPLDLLTAQAC